MQFSDDDMKKITQQIWYENWKYNYSLRHFFRFEDLSQVFYSIDTVIFSQLNEKITIENFCCILQELLIKFFRKLQNKEYQVKNNWKNSKIYQFQDYSDDQLESIEDLLFISDKYGYYLNDLLLCTNLLELYENNMFHWHAKSVTVPKPFYLLSRVSKDVEFKEIVCPYSRFDPAVLQINVYALDNDFDFNQTIKEIQEQIVVFRYQHQMKLSPKEYFVAKDFIIENKITSFEISSNYLRTIGIILFDNKINDSPKKIREFLYQHNLLFYKNKKCNISECTYCHDLDSCTRYLNEAKRITDLCIKSKSVLSTKTKSNEIDLPEQKNYYYNNLKLYLNFLEKLDLNNVLEIKKQIANYYKNLS